jgi:fermentation-respiration switch protein FrsA (DUF1100 family)
VLGCPLAQEGAATLRRFSLKGVAVKFSCPLLIVHGGGDRQILGDQGKKTYDAAVGYQRARVFRALVGFQIPSAPPNFG